MKIIYQPTLNYQPVAKFLAINKSVDVVLITPSDALFSQRLALSHDIVACGVSDDGFNLTYVMNKP